VLNFQLTQTHFYIFDTFQYPDSLSGSYDSCIVGSRVYKSSQYLKTTKCNCSMAKARKLFVGRFSAASNLLALSTKHIQSTKENRGLKYKGAS